MSHYSAQCNVNKYSRSPDDSMRDAVFTESPNRQYLNVKNKSNLNKSRGELKSKFENAVTSAF